MDRNNIEFRFDYNEIRKIRNLFFHFWKKQDNYIDKIDAKKVISTIDKELMTQGEGK